MALSRSWTIAVLLVLQAVLILTVFRGTSGFMRGMERLQQQLLLGASSSSSPRAKRPAAPRMAFDSYFRELYHYRAREAPADAQEEAQLAEQIDDECGPFPHAKFFGQNKARRSRLNEDRIVFETFFQDVPPEKLRTYKYVEIGGFNGMEESNSRFFETCLRWEGLLVEPNPFPFSKLVENRPRAHRASYAVSCSEEDDAIANRTVPFHNYIFSNAAQAGTTVNAYAGGRTIEVPCGPVHPVVHSVLGPRVHFFSLDVEGAEPMVLRAIDFEAIRVDVLLVEVHNQFCLPHQQCASRNETREIMRANGYYRFENYVPASDVHVHPHSELLAKILARREPAEFAPP